MIADREPDAALAVTLAEAAIGCRPVGARRFTTGAHHYVFEVDFADHEPMVVRVNTATGQAAMSGAAELSRLLRPLGVPLPELIAADLSLPFPHLVLQRLPGTDLVHAFDSLSRPQLEAIAGEVAQAQRIAASTGSAGRYGYAVNPAAAPHSRWSAVVREHLDRSRHRIAAAGLFGPEPVNRISELLATATDALDAQPATPFLHDTSTKNVIVTAAGAFSGIVDVDDLCFGDPRYVMALTLASLMARGRSGDYVHAWMQLADFPDDRLFRLYVALFLLDFMSEHGQTFNGNQQASSPDARQSLLRVFDEQLRRTALDQV